MISNQVIQTSIDELKTITKVDLCVIDMEGTTVASTFDSSGVSQELVQNFVHSPADSQIVGGYHMLKILEDGGCALRADIKRAKCGFIYDWKSGSVSDTKLGDCL